MHIVIAGAGIGGLTAALALHANGHRVTVLERVREPRALGVGINLLPHAVRELDALGLGSRLPGIGVATSEIGYYAHDGSELFVEPRGLAGGYQHPQWSVHRGRLQLVLLDEVRDRLGHDAVRTGTAVRGVEQDADRAGVRTDRGLVTGDVVLGADGLHSVVRAALHPGADPLLWSGVRMWRGTTEAQPFKDGRSMAIVRGHGVELVLYPIGPHTLNWVLEAKAGDAGPLPGTAGWNTPADRAEVLGLVRGWDLGWIDVAGLVRDAAEVLEYPMVDREPLPHWGSGRITLLGDAAHPMYPVGANGASQAVVDASVLAAALSSQGLAGLAEYERTRRAATAEVVAANRAMQRTWHSSSTAELARTAHEYRIATETAANPQPSF